MKADIGAYRLTRVARVLLPAFAAMALLALTVVPSAATHGGFHVEPLATGSFPDAIDAKVKLKLGEGTKVVHVRDPSNMFVARITFDPGGGTGWHTHPGPVFVTVLEGELTIIDADDCVERTYEAGQAFVDPGHGNIHIGINNTAEPTVVYATFLEVPPGGPATIPFDGDPCAS